MIWENFKGERIKATPKAEAVCDLCNGELIPKCGEIKIWHWAHKSLVDCDSWYEPESEWHINWKNKFPKEQQEVRMGEHKADIRNKWNMVIELQNSSISSENIFAREEYYNSMIWLLNGESLCSGIELRKKGNIITFRWKHPNKSLWVATKNLYVDLNYRRYYLEEKISKILRGKKIFKTKSEEVDNDWGDETHWESWKEDITNETLLNLQNERNLLLSLGNILVIRKIHKNIPCGGWGILISKERFLKEVRDGTGY